MEKPRIVLCNKIDIEGAERNAVEIVEAIHKIEPETKVIPISIQNNMGMNGARNAIITLVNQLENRSSLQAEISRNEFLATRSVDEDMEVQYPGSEK